MRVQVAAQVRSLHQLRQCAARGLVDLASAFAQLGWDPVAAERGVDVLFRLAGDGFA